MLQTIKELTYPKIEKLWVINTPRIHFHLDQLWVIKLFSVEGRDRAIIVSQSPNQAMIIDFR